MTGRIRDIGTGVCVLALLLSCVLAEPEPEPEPAGPIFGDDFDEDAESQLLLKRLKQIAERKQEAFEQERELTEEQIAIQEILEEKMRSQRKYAKDDAEVLPVPSAVIHAPIRGEKRTSYMTLCHFKICNMGRKRQMIPEMRGLNLANLKTELTLDNRSQMRRPRPY
ncbi:uncharacterized protein LOC105700892 [Orussus abietinus]|uniref:uncharacterized protein LOC105700892 n=1 Tax=Orussus abietinus TaxID=222816 RepID=UPI00062663FC|nr:uncharacterized protein LOC105700892 [Orussus abietinus]XP_012282566.1 uncharacterized protein LOC105700892 [Orussus abietinus]